MPPALIGLAIVATLVFFLALTSALGFCSEHLDALTHFAPFYMSMAACLLVFAVRCPSSAYQLYIGSLSLLAVILCAAQIAPELLASRQTLKPSHDTIQLKIVQFNAWAANRDSQRAADWILEQQPDFVVLQEGFHVRDRILNAGGYYANCVDCRAVILSRLQPLTTNSGAPLEGRGDMMSAATYLIADRQLTIVGVHKSWPIRTQRLRFERSELLALARQGGSGSIIIAGDFNSTPWSYALRRLDRDLRLDRRTRALATWPTGRSSHYALPAPFPFMPIDHVYASEDWRTVSTIRGPRLGSDHYPIVVVLAQA